MLRTSLIRIGGAASALILLLCATPAWASKATAPGEQLFRSGKVREALASFERATPSQPGDADAWYWLAAARFETGRTGLAEAAVQKALAIDPSSAEAWVLYGCIAQDRGRYDDARARYLKSLEVRPDGVGAAELRVVLAQLPFEAS
jgi:Flp pilus assembly protein TadD